MNKKVIIISETLCHQTFQEKVNRELEKHNESNIEIQYQMSTSGRNEMLYTAMIIVSCFKKIN
tara:strand:- start:1696 stop:1884 length:189 start_codon:yes stop_codon:yes gene_type:complete